MIETSRILYVFLVCPCGKSFTGNAYNVPCLRGAAICPRCWDFVNDLRVRCDQPAWETPPHAYPDE